MEACDCDTLCPCCADENPSNGSCNSIFAYHIDRGQISGVDVGNLTVLAVVYSPGTMAAGNWRRAILVDDKGSREQLVAIGDAFEGRLGGPLADLSALVKEHVGVFEAPMIFQASGGKGSFSVGGNGSKVSTSFTPVAVRASMAPTGGSTTTQPGSTTPTTWGKAPATSVNLPEHGINWSVQNRHASTSTFRFEV
jgi:hypothetical protein